MRFLVSAVFILWTYTSSEAATLAVNKNVPEKNKNNSEEEPPLVSIGRVPKKKKKKTKTATDSKETPNWQPIFGAFPVGATSWKKFKASIISKDGSCVAVAGRYRDQFILQVNMILPDGTIVPRGNPITPKQNDRDDDLAWNIDNGGISLSANCKHVALGDTLSETIDGDGNRLLGAVRVYKFANRKNRWKQVGNDILGSQVFEDFAERISLSDDGKRIATCGEDWNMYRGRCRVYEWTDHLDRWEQIGQTILGGENKIKNIGDTLRLSGDGRIFVAEGEGEDGRDRVYVYEYDESGPTPRWTPRAQLTGGKTNKGGFGYSLDLSTTGDTIAVGAPAWNDRDSGADDAGKVKLYQWSNLTSSYERLGSSIHGQNEDACGDSVSLSSDGYRLAVGCDQRGFRDTDSDEYGNSTKGYVMMFEYDDVTGEWNQLGDSIVGVDKENLGKRELVAISGDGSRLFVCSPGRALLFQYAIASSAATPITTIEFCGDEVKVENSLIVPYEVQNRSPLGQVTILPQPGRDADFSCPGFLDSFEKSWLFLKLEMKDCKGNPVTDVLVDSGLQPTLRRILKFGSNGLETTNITPGTLRLSKSGRWQYRLQTAEVGGDGCYAAEFEIPLPAGGKVYANAAFKLSNVTK